MSEGTMNETKTPTELPAGEYAIVELFGHTTLVGRVEEIERFGTKMLAIEPLFDGALLPVVFHGGAAIYRFTPCSAQIAWDRQPRHGYQLPPAIRAIVPETLLPAPDTSLGDILDETRSSGTLAPDDDDDSEHADEEFPL